MFKLPPRMSVVSGMRLKNILHSINQDYFLVLSTSYFCHLVIIIIHHIYKALFSVLKDALQKQKSWCWHIINDKCVSCVAVSSPNQSSCVNSGLMQCKMQYMWPCQTVMWPSKSGQSQATVSVLTVVFQSQNGLPSTCVWLFATSVQVCLCYFLSG